MTEALDKADSVSREYQTHLQAAHMHLSAYGSLSFTRRVDEVTGHMETAYRLHLMDLTSYRLVPHLLGVTERDCDHLACEMVLLNAYCAGYMMESGRGCDHASQRAMQMLHENGGRLM